MVTFSEMNVVWYSSLHDFHMMCPNDGAIDKGSCTKQIAGTSKTFEYEKTRSVFKCCDHWEKMWPHPGALLQVNDANDKQWM